MASWNNALWRVTRRVLLSISIFAAGIPTASNAFAISLKVQIACATDYYAHCSAYSPYGSQVRSCMRAVGSKLSKRCVDALVSDGEVSAAEVARRRGISETAAR